MKRNKINSFMLKLSVYRFFDDFILIYPLYAVMFADFDVSVSNISILFLAWSVTAFVLEVPSGVIADKFDRKLVLIIAQVFRIVGYLCWLFFPTFIGFLMGFIFWGIKGALTTGTLEAYLYDGLEEAKKVKDYSKELGRLKSLSFIAILAASSIATGIYSQGYSVILSLSILSLVISTFSLVSMEKIKRRKSTRDTDYFQLFRKGVLDVIQSPKLLIVVLIGAFFIGIMAIDEYLPIFIEQNDIEPVFIGIIFALYTLAQSVGALIAYKVSSLKDSLYLLLAIFGISFVALSFTSGETGVFIFILLGFIIAVAQVISAAQLQEAVDGSVRSTVASISSFFAEIVAFSVYGLTSMLSSELGLVGTFRYLGYGSVVLVIMLILGGVLTQE